MASVPIVFLSAQANVEYIERAKELGAEGYLTKPFQFDGIIDKVRDVLGD